MSDAAFDAQALLDEARQARERSYAPYSKFRVGAAVLAKSGTVFRGCNVENASYGLTVCAERVAIQTMVASGERELVAVAIVAGGSEGIRVTPPCGACRQVIHEFAPEAQVVLPGANGDPPQVNAIAEFLPRGFGPGDLVDAGGGA